MCSGEDRGRGRRLWRWDWGPGFIDRAKSEHEGFWGAGAAGLCWLRRRTDVGADVGDMWAVTWLGGAELAPGWERGVRGGGAWFVALLGLWRFSRPERPERGISNPVRIRGVAISVAWKV